MACEENQACFLGGGGGGGYNKALIWGQVPMLESRIPSLRAV